QQSQSGIIVGTVGYMSPEQAQGKTREIDHRSDIFSFGCMLYEAITSRRPFEGTDTIDTLNRIIREPVTPITEFNPLAPPDLQRIVRRCLAKDREDRYQTIKDVAIEIKELRHELKAAGIDTTPTPDRSIPNTASGAEPTRILRGNKTPSSSSFVNRESNKAAVGIIVALVIVAGIVAAVFYWRSSKSAAPAIDSIAVLPFLNQNNDSNIDWIADGLTES